MKRLFIQIFTSVLILSSACNPLKIKHHQDETVDFSKYKTFSFFGWTKESENINELDKKRLEKAFEAEFKKRGIEFVKENGNLVVSLFVQIDNETRATTYANHYNMAGYGYYGYYYSYDWSYGASTNISSFYDERDYHVGTLVVDVLDTQTKKLIWQSVGSRTINENANIREKNTPKLAASMMQSFPVKPVK